MQTIDLRSDTVTRPTDAMRDSDEELYWRKDHHLAVSGHRFVAEHLYRELQGLL